MNLSDPLLCPACRLPIGIHQHGLDLWIAHPPAYYGYKATTDRLIGWVAKDPPEVERQILVWAGNQHDEYGR